MNCQCNYRSKSKSSYLSLNAEPPQLAVDSQETARYASGTIVSDYSMRDNITLMHDLQILQNKAAKVILDLPNYASSTDGLKTLGWPTLFQERLVHRYITTFKYIHGLVDHNFNILRNSDIHNYMPSVILCYSH